MSTTEQPVAESGPTIESRMSALYTAAPEPEGEAPQPEVVESAEKPEEAPEEEDSFDFEADDGTTVKLPLSMKDAALRHADYTQKTQALAKERSLVESKEKLAADKLQFAEAREQLSSEILNDLTEFKAAEKELKQYQSLDWAALYQANPGQAAALQYQMSELKDKIKTLETGIQGKASTIQQATTMHQAKQWEEAEKGARSLIGTITAAENVAMAQTVKALGFSEAEFKQKCADPRLIAAVHKAAKWDALQAGKSVAVETAGKAPPVVKPGASKGAKAASESRYQEARQSLKKSGSLEDVARLFRIRGI